MFTSTIDVSHQCSMLYYNYIPTYVYHKILQDHKRQQLFIACKFYSVYIYFAQNIYLIECTSTLKMRNFFSNIYLFYLNTPRLVFSYMLRTCKKLVYTRQYRHSNKPIVTSLKKDQGCLCCMQLSFKIGSVTIANNIVAMCCKKIKPVWSHVSI